MRFFLAALLVAAIPLCAQSLSGRRAPSFSLPDSTLKQHDIQDYRGRWLLIDFMKTDCPHCKLLSQELESIKRKYAGKVALLSIVISPPENMGTVAKYINDNKLTNPIVFDMGQVAVTYFNATPQRPTFDTPHLFAIDPNGAIVRDWDQEAVEAKSFPNELDQLISSKK